MLVAVLSSIVVDGFNLMGAQASGYFTLSLILLSGAYLMYLFYYLIPYALLGGVDGREWLGFIMDLLCTIPTLYLIVGCLPFMWIGIPFYGAYLYLSFNKPSYSSSAMPMQVIDSTDVDIAVDGAVDKSEESAGERRETTHSSDDDGDNEQQQQQHTVGSAMWEAVNTLLLLPLSHNYIVYKAREKQRIGPRGKNNGAVYFMWFTIMQEEAETEADVGKSPGPYCCSEGSTKGRG